VNRRVEVEYALRFPWEGPSAQRDGFGSLGEVKEYLYEQCEDDEIAGAELLYRERVVTVEISDWRRLPVTPDWDSVEVMTK
jgi:hypothetical protein